MGQEIISTDTSHADHSGQGAVPLVHSVPLDDWLSPPSGNAPNSEPEPGPGPELLKWLMPHFAASVQGIFGFHAIQLGLPSIRTLAMSRIPYQWVLSDNLRQPSAHVYANASALPFFEATLDLVTLPFTLDAHFDPEAVMDEVARVLVPEGKVIIAGINSRSPWGLAQQLGLPRWPKALPGFGFSRVQAALADLGLVIDYLQFGAHGFAEDTVSKPSVWAAASQRFWPQSGGVYFLVAKKRVLGVRPTRRLPWRLPKLAQLPLRPYPAPRPSHLQQDP